MSKKVGVSFNIDVTKIDKTRLYQGAKGTYLSCTVFVYLDEKDQYDNSGMITQDVSKEEREQGAKGNILGNVKVFWQGEGAGQQSQQSNQQNQEAQQSQQAPQSFDNFDDDIPF